MITGCYVAGALARRVDEVLRTLGINGISKSQLSVMAKSLDDTVVALRNRPLDGGPYPYVWLDALTMRSRDDGGIVIPMHRDATPVNADGHCEILGVDVLTAGDGAAWTGFLIPTRRNPGCAS